MELKCCRKVDKIVGPRKYLRGACQACCAIYGHVSIGSIAGPSEILAVSLRTRRYPAVCGGRSLISGRALDELASAILITTSEDARKNVSDEVDIDFLEVLERKDIIQKSLENYGYISLWRPTWGSH